MHKIASDMNKAKRESFFIFTKGRRIDVYLLVDKLQGDTQSWLSPPDPWKNHNIACGSRHTGTARWFSKAILSQNGSRLDRVRSCGFMANVRGRPVYLLSQRLMVFPHL